ncbi:glycoside hydrolase family 13 protein [Zasmidium cellare ATCC 36951]|uniref:alpha-amylase n=1 Tax=Zasmidium cellare ATCC 36951 TaxID=1080233 RepID=A0A6A6CKR4_ZASCE|nr:glycoside hydrolase family 13 protein [Zasmidium cellare ATCC 36951]KAF2166522.1 glycoside hydrolase family 13 protein [Zasmidium cellare ATCC 36951]
MATSLGFLYVFISIVALVSGLTPAQWRSQSIYQVMTDRFARTDGSTTAGCDLNEYCGGTWQGLINRLDYIQSMGFTAIWISPVVKNPIASTQDGNSYHGYWAQDAYALNPKFGTSADLKALSNELHSRGMYLMVDVVPNHMGSISSQTTVDYSKFNPFNKQSYFHKPCNIDYNNQTSVTQCWLGDNIVSLPDLRTEDSNVANMWNTWIGQLVSNYSIDGLRIDTAQQIDTAFWAGFQSAAKGIHTLGEVFNGDPNYICPYQNYLHGILNYGTYYWITQAFQSTSGSISNLVNGINQMKSTCKDVTVLGSFLENHDNPRFPSYTQDIVLIRTAITFTMLADGIPIIYQGQEQKFSGSNVPSNREALWTAKYNQNADLYLHIQKLNRIRSWAIRKDSTYLTYNAWPIWSDSKTIVMRKGYAGKQIVSVYSNSGSNGGTRTITINSGNSGFTAGEKVTEVLRCEALTADSRGNVGVSIPTGRPGILYPTAGLRGSGICGL